MSKSLLTSLALLFGAICGLYLGLTINRPINKPCFLVQYDELDEIRDTSYYTGKDRSDIRFAPTNIKRGVIPNAEIAASIAYDYVKAVYGENDAIREQPYQVQLLNGQIWSVSGFLPQETLGGTFHIAIEKFTGKIWYIYHEK